MSETQKNTGRRTTSDAIEIIDALVGTDPARREQAGKAFEDAVVGQLIYDARTAAGLTQTKLAELVGTDQRVISRLEDANYEGHSLSMLRRIADALGKKLDIRFVDAA